MSSVKLDDEGSLFRQLLLENQDLPEDDSLPFFLVKPKPGFCVKVKSDKNEKIFVNICHSSQLKAPADITESELFKILEAEASDFRIPMSLGEQHIELDNSGNPCSVYDVIINDKFFEKIKNAKLFQNFFVNIVMEGLEEKYNLTLTREWVVLKNRKFLGAIQDQNIKKNSKPKITEMSSLGSKIDDSNTIKNSLKSVTDKVPNNKQSIIEPECSIIKDPAEGHPQFLVAEVKLPEVNSAKDIELDLGEDRVILKSNPMYVLDIFLPYFISQQDSCAQFNKKNKILTLTLPVIPV